MSAEFGSVNVLGQSVLRGLNTNGGVLVGMILFICLTSSPLYLKLLSILLFLFREV